MQVQAAGSTRSARFKGTCPTVRRDFTIAMEKDLEGCRAL